MKDRGEDWVLSVREEGKRNGRFVGAAETRKSVQMAQASAQNLNILGLPKKKGGLSATERAVGKDARATFSKSKRNRAIARITRL